MTDSPTHVGRYEGPHAPMTGRWVCADDCPHPDHREGKRGVSLVPTVVDAEARCPVRLPDGRTARLLSVPSQSARRSNGGKARVVLPSGAVLSFPLAELQVLPLEAGVER